METAVNQNLPQHQSQRSSDNVSSSRKRPLDHNVRLEDSPYFKMRAIVRDLRPHFIEVLKTPDFQNCKAAEEIRERLLPCGVSFLPYFFPRGEIHVNCLRDVCKLEMKIVVDLYKTMIAEPPRPESKNATAGHPSSGETEDGQKHQPPMKPPEKPHADWPSTRNAENKSFFPGSKQPEGSRSEDGQKHQPPMKPPEKPHADWPSTRNAENKSFFPGSKQPEGSRSEGTHVVGGSAFGWNFITFPENKVTYYGRSKESFRSANVKRPEAE